MFKRILVMFFVLVICCAVADANMKKANVGSKGSKGFAFNSYTDGVCSVSVIYDKASADLNIGVGLSDGTLVAASLSPEKYIETLETGLYGFQTYLLVVVSNHGATSFRVVVRCTEQEDLVTAGIGSGAGLREIPDDANTKRLSDQIRKITDKNKK
jgi:hypothetical protein